MKYINEFKLRIILIVLNFSFNSKKSYNIFKTMTIYLIFTFIFYFIFIDLIL
jgi:hypothetical protein